MGMQNVILKAVASISKNGVIAKGIMALATFAKLLIEKAIVIIKNAELSDLIRWISIGIEKIQKVVQGIIYGFKQFFQRIKGKFSQITRHYSKDNDQWYETEIKRTTDVENISAEMLDGVSEDECDRTEWLENELS